MASRVDCPVRADASSNQGQPPKETEYSAYIFDCQRKHTTEAHNKERQS